MDPQVSEGGNAAAVRTCGFSPTICDPNALAASGPESSYPTCAVRYGHMEYIGEFRYSQGTLNGCGTKVVVQTNRGIEIGEHVSLTCSGCRNSINRQQMLSYVKNSEAAEFFQPRAGRILRQATSQDLIEEAKIKEDSKEKLARAKELADSLGLDMRLIACEHLFGGERMIFHFMSESRVDFRELVRDLAHEYHTRIEMHQVGARDEARLIADYEICGRECCCKNFLKKLRPVTMRMAKLQKATLDPTKVSGRCGRLRCCLRYEYEGYEELSKKLPRVGSRIRTEKGIGTVKDRQVLTQLVTVVYDERDLEEAIAVEQILERNLPKPPPAPPHPDADSASTARVEQPSRQRRQPPASAQAPAGARTEQRPNRPPRQDRPTGGEVQPVSEGVAELAGGDEKNAESPAQATDPESGKRGRRRGRRGRRRQRRPQVDGSSGANDAPASRERNEASDRKGPASGAPPPGSS